MPRAISSGATLRRSYAAKVGVAGQLAVASVRKGHLSWGAGLPRKFGIVGVERNTSPLDVASRLESFGNRFVFVCATSDSLARHSLGRPERSAACSVRSFIQRFPAPDANDDNRVDVSDAVRRVTHLLQHGDEPPAPFPLLGASISAVRPGAFPRGPGRRFGSKCLTDGRAGYVLHPLHGAPGAPAPAATRTTC